MTGEELLRRARDASQNAIAPYSLFPVGAAVESDDGRIFLGCNVESASYGLTVCAERIAIFSALAAGAHPMTIAVTCPAGDLAVPDSLTPCGACRQVMLDQMGPGAACHIDGVGSFTIEQLLPHGFRLP